MGREVHCKQISLACVGSAHGVWTTLGLPQLNIACAFLIYTVQAPGFSAGHCPKRALCFKYFPGLSHSGSASWAQTRFSMWFCTLPKSEQLRRPGAWWVHWPRWAVRLNHLPCPSHSVFQCTARIPSQVCHVSPLGTWSQAVTLLAGVNRPGSQEDMVSNWEPTHSLVEDASLCCRDWTSPLPYSSGCYTPASLPPAGGEEPVHSQLALLWYSLNPLFCEQSRLWLRAFRGKVLLFFPFWGSHGLDCYLT